MKTQDIVSQIIGSEELFSDMVGKLLDENKILKTEIKRLQEAPNLKIVVIKQQRQIEILKDAINRMKTIKSDRTAHNTIQTLKQENERLQKETKEWKSFAKKIITENI